MCANNAHNLSKKLENKGIKTLNKIFFNEFVIEVPDSDSFLKKLKEANILGGIKLDSKRILVCATEMNSEEDIETYISVI